MQSLILAEVEWKLSSFMKLLIERQRTAGPGPNRPGDTSWAMAPDGRNTTSKFRWADRISLVLKLKLVSVKQQRYIISLYGFPK